MTYLPSNLLPGLAADWPAPLKRINYLFTFAFFALAAFAGSASMALFVGAGIWAILSLGLYRFDLVADRGARLIALVFAAYYMSGVVNTVVHWGDRESLHLLIQRLPFLGFLPVLSRLSLSKGSVTLEALENGALAGIALATPVAVVQLFQSNARPEAFSGNPSMYALAMTVLFVVACVAAGRRGACKALARKASLHKEIAIWGAGQAKSFALSTQTDRQTPIAHRRHCNGQQRNAPRFDCPRAAIRAAGR